MFPPGFPEVLKHQAEFDAMAASAVRDKVAADLVEWVCERFGYRFQDPSLALRAFTHCSHPMLASNQRLEFLVRSGRDVLRAVCTLLLLGLCWALVWGCCCVGAAVYTGVCATVSEQSKSLCCDRRATLPLTGSSP